MTTDAMLSKLCAFSSILSSAFFFFQAEDGIRDVAVTGVQTCALPISPLVRPVCSFDCRNLRFDSAHPPPGQDGSPAFRGRAAARRAAAEGMILFWAEIGRAHV